MERNDSQSAVSPAERTAAVLSLLGPRGDVTGGGSGARRETQRPQLRCEVVTAGKVVRLAPDHRRRRRPGGRCGGSPAPATARHRARWRSSAGDGASQLAAEMRWLRRSSSTCGGLAQAWDGNSPLAAACRYLRRDFSACNGASLLATEMRWLRRRFSACGRPAQAGDGNSELAAACRCLRRDFSACNGASLLATDRHKLVTEILAL